MVKVARKKTSGPEDPSILVRSFLAFKTMKADVEAQFNEARDKLKKYVDKNAVPDDKGHLWIEFDEPIEGVKALKHERRVTPLLDVEEAMALIRTRGLQDRLILSQVTLRGEVDSDTDLEDALAEYGFVIEGDIEERLDEDALYAAVYDDDIEISADDILDLTKEKISWALKVET